MEYYDFNDFSIYDGDVISCIDILLDKNLNSSDAIFYSYILTAILKNLFHQLSLFLYYQNQKME